MLVLSLVPHFRGSPVRVTNGGGPPLVVLDAALLPVLAVIRRTRGFRLWRDHGRLGVFGRAGLARRNAA